MDRQLHALVTRDLLTDTVWIDVRGSLNEESRRSLLHLIKRVRSMGIFSPIRVDISRAALVESAALAGLRTVLNAVDGGSAPENTGAGVSLVSVATAGAPASGSIGAQPLAITDEPAVVLEIDAAQSFADEFEWDTQPSGEAVFGRPLSAYSDDELFAASDLAFTLLDNPEAFGGADLLGRYNDIGAEISRRNLLTGLHGTAGQGHDEHAEGGQLAS